MDVRSVMTNNPACCSRQTPLPDVAKMMLDNDCGEIPVVDDGGSPLGVVTDRDIATRIVAQSRDTNNCTAADAMSSPAQTVRLDSSIEEAINTMESAQIRRLPVIDESGKVCGMVSQADVALANKDGRTGEVVREVSRPRAH